MKSSRNLMKYKTEAPSRLNTFDLKKQNECKKKKKKYQSVDMHVDFNVIKSTISKFLKRKPNKYNKRKNILINGSFFKIGAKIYYILKFMLKLKEKINLTKIEKLNDFHFKIINDKAYFQDIQINHAKSFSEKLKLQYQEFCLLKQKKFKNKMKRILFG